MTKPDYMETYESFWADLVETGDGALNKDAVARELSDYSFLMDQVTTVYSELADLSKPNYHAHAILGVINDRQEEHYREHYAERLCDSADEAESEEVRAQLLELAEEWSPGSVEQHRRDREMVDRLRGERDAARREHEEPPPPRPEPRWGRFCVVWGQAARSYACGEAPRADLTLTLLALVTSTRLVDAHEDDAHR
jgi:hypothetical protein